MGVCERDFIWRKRQGLILKTNQASGSRLARQGSLKSSINNINFATSDYSFKVNFILELDIVHLLLSKPKNASSEVHHQRFLSWIGLLKNWLLEKVASFRKFCPKKTSTLFPRFHSHPCGLICFNTGSFFIPFLVKDFGCIHKVFLYSFGREKTWASLSSDNFSLSIYWPPHCASEALVRSSPVARISFIN